MQWRKVIAARAIGIGRAVEYVFFIFDYFLNSLINQIYLLSLLELARGLAVLDLISWNWQTDSPKTVVVYVAVFAVAAAAVVVAVDVGDDEGRLID